MRFKKGDKVRVVATTERLESIGIYTTNIYRKAIIRDIDFHFTLPIQIELTNLERWWVQEIDLVPVEVAQTVVETPMTTTLKQEDIAAFPGCLKPFGNIRTFSTGATRDTDVNKLDYEGFLSPLVLERYAQYLNKHRVQSDGALRDSDNWQKGIPQDQYIKSAWRHFMEWWKIHRNWFSGDAVELFEDSLCAVLFNVMGYLHEHLRKKYGK